MATGAGTYIVHVNNPTGVSHTVGLDISRGMCTVFDDAIGFPARVPSKSLPKWFLGNTVSVMKVGIKPGGVSSIRLGGARTGATGPPNVGGAPNAAAVCIEFMPPDDDANNDVLGMLDGLSNRSVARTATIPTSTIPDDGSILKSVTEQMRKVCDKDGARAEKIRKLAVASLTCYKRRLCDTGGT